VEEILPFNKFFLIVDKCLSCKDTSRVAIKLCNAAQMANFYSQTEGLEQ